MAISFNLSAELRKDKGKGASRRLRRLGKVPGIIYGAGEPPVDLLFDHNELRNSLAHDAFYSHILTVKVGNQEQQAILKDVQRHPFKNAILHIDFQRVEENEKIRIAIPLHFKGAAVSPGVKSQGGIVSHMRNEVEVSCLPKDLPEFIEVDMSGLSLNESIHLSQLQVPPGVQLLDLAREDSAVAAIHSPRAEEPEPTAAAAEGAAAPAEGAAAAAPAPAAAAGDAAKKAEPATPSAKKEPAKKDAKK